MKKLDDISTPSAFGGFMAKTKFKLDGIRYRGKLKALDWNKYEAHR